MYEYHGYYAGLLSLATLEFEDYDHDMTTEIRQYELTQ